MWGKFDGVRKASQSELIGLAATSSNMFLGFALMLTYSNVTGELWLLHGTLLTSGTCSKTKPAPQQIQKTHRNRGTRNPFLGAQMMCPYPSKLLSNTWVSEGKIRGRPPRDWFDPMFQQG